MNDPFAGIEDESPQTPAEMRASLLRDSHRGYTPVRKILVQRPSEAAERPSTIGEMVSERQENALRLLLLALAFQPLEGLALPPQRWAGLVNCSSKLACSQSQLARAIKQLQDRRLVVRDGTTHLFGLVPLMEDGSGQGYTRPTAKGAVVGKGFFIVPHDAWTSGLIDNLRLPGLAMFLISLHDTHQKPSFQVPLDKMAKWYGVSERTAERGYDELANQRVLLTRTQRVAARSAASGLRTVTHRALADPYSKSAREALQAAARGRVRAQSAKKPRSGESDSPGSLVLT